MTQTSFCSDLITCWMCTCKHDKFNAIFRISTFWDNYFGGMLQLFFQSLTTNSKTEMYVVTIPNPFAWLVSSFVDTPGYPVVILSRMKLPRRSEIWRVTCSTVFSSRTTPIKTDSKLYFLCCSPEELAYHRRIPPILQGCADQLCFFVEGSRSPLPINI